MKNRNAYKYLILILIKIFFLGHVNLFTVLLMMVTTLMMVIK